MKTNWRQTAPRTLADAVRGPDYGSPYCPAFDEWRFEREAA